MPNKQNSYHDVKNRFSSRDMNRERAYERFHRRLPAMSLPTREHPLGDDRVMSLFIQTLIENSRRPHGRVPTKTSDRRKR